MRSIVGEKWHLIVHEAQGDQLYDWTRDPGEANDQMDTVEGKAAAGHLRQNWKTELENGQEPNDSSVLLFFKSLS